MTLCVVDGCTEPGTHHVSSPGTFGAPEVHARMCAHHADAFLLHHDVERLREERRQELGDRYAREALIAAEVGDDDA